MSEGRARWCQILIVHNPRPVYFPHVSPTVTDNSRSVHTPVNSALLHWLALVPDHHWGSSPCKENVMTQKPSLRRVLLFLALATFAIALVPKTAFAGDDREPYAI